MPSRSALLRVALGVLAFAPARVAGEPGSRQPASPSPAETIERVVAVIDGRPLLLSDVQVLAAVRALAAQSALEAAIAERLMYVEASRLAQTEVRPEDETAAIETLLAREPRLRARVPEPDLRRLLRRQLTILKYVEFRFRPQIRVTDEEVRKAWEAEEVGGPAGLALEDAQEAIRARLERRALDARVETWIAELRARADVRKVDPIPTLATGP